MAVSYGTYTITEVQEGSQIWTSSVAPTTPNYTFDVSHLTGDSDVPVREGDIILNSYYRYTVLSISSDGTTVLTGNRTSIRGEAGAASVTYSLIVSNLAIVKDKNDILSPTSITLTAKSQTGSNAMANYSGRFKIETTTNNSTWTTQYISSANEATKNWTVIDDIIAVRCSLYLKDGTTTLLDQQTIPIVSDGIDGTDGNDAYSIILTNENHTFAGNTTSALESEIECNVIAYKGATQVVSTIGTITGQPTGMTTTLLNNSTINTAFKVNVTTSMVTKNGVLIIPITVDGKSFTKEFTYTLTLDGEDGKDGGKWYSGTKITGTSTTATIFADSGITSAVIGDMYLNTSTYNTYRCTVGGNASAAKWIYVNNIKGTTGKGISSITNQYYLSTSDITQSDGSWSDTPQTYIEGRYYWTRSHIVWDDGGSPTDTTPVLDNALTDANANAIDARKVATNYLSMDSTGIMVADMNDGEQKPSEATGNNVFIDNISVNIRDGQTTLASFGVDGMQIGLNEESHINQDYHSWRMIDKDGNTYAYISDLRDETGMATITEINVPLEYYYDKEYCLTPSFQIDSVDSIVSVIINDNPVDSFELIKIVPYSNNFIRTVPKPVNGDNTKIVYKSSSNLLKAYTLGNRKENSNIGAYSFVEGYNNIGSGSYSHVEGYDNTASAIGSHAEGHNNTASGNISHVEGGSNTASGNCSHAEGCDCVASGLHSHAEGWSTVASGGYAHAEGTTSRAKGTASHAEGYSDANADGSHAEGSSTANAWYSHAEGNGTANGESSHAEGGGIANGNLSHAEGTSTANGVLAHAQNQGTKASSRAQTAIGKYNIEDTNDIYAFIIGNGDSSTRSNALTVKWDGTITASNGFGTATSQLSITRVNNSYFDATAISRLSAWKRSGILFIVGNLMFTTSMPTNTDVTIAKINGWSAVSGIWQTVAGQNNSAPISISIQPNGNIIVSNYSGTTVGNWHRFAMSIPSTT